MKTTLRINNLSCANCAAKMEAEIKKLEGVQSATVNFVLQKLVIEAEEESMPELLKKAGSTAKKFHPECTLTLLK